MRIALAATVLAAAAATTPAAAQADDPIVVTGQREQIENFVRALTPGSPRSQIARFENEICPRALGFTDAQRATVEQRIRLVAENVGLKVGEPDKCLVNLLVIVTPDKLAFVKALGRDNNYMFGNRSPGEVREILAQPGSAIAWQVEGALNADGNAVMVQQGTPVNRTGHKGSRITAAARPYIAGAVVVFDARALDGLSTTQIADYAMMRGFADVDLARLDGASAPTILRALDAPGDAEVPMTLTQWDFAFLKGLYSAPNNLYAPSQRSEIGRVLEQEIGGADAKDKPAPDRSKG
jgi:hypothetical protein